MELAPKRPQAPFGPRGKRLLGTGRTHSPGLKAGGGFFGGCFHPGAGKSGGRSSPFGGGKPRGQPGGGPFHGPRRPQPFRADRARRFHGERPYPSGRQGDRA